MSQCPKCMHSAKTVLDDVEIACKRVVHDAPDRADCSVTNDMWRRWKGENREEGKLIAQLEGTAEPEAPPAEAEVETPFNGDNFMDRAIREDLAAEKEMQEEREKRTSK